MSLDHQTHPVVEMSNGNRCIIQPWVRVLLFLNVLTLVCGFAQDTAIRTRKPPVIAELRRLYEVASALSKRGEFTNSIQVFQKAIALGEEELGRNDSLVGVLLAGLASVHGQGGDFAEALRLRHRVLEISERNHGKDSPEVALALWGLATDHLSNQAFDRAAALLERSLRIRESIHGHDITSALKCRDIRHWSARVRACLREMPAT